MTEMRPHLTLPMEDGTEQTFIVVAEPGSEGQQPSPGTWFWMKSPDELIDTGMTFVPSAPHFRVDQRQSLTQWYTGQHVKEWVRQDLKEHVAKWFGDDAGRSERS